MIDRMHPVAMRPLVLRLLVLATAVVTVFLLLASAGAANEPPPPTIAYTVESGDTLWAIATELAEPGSDVRDTVDTIMALNGLEDATIRPGHSIRLPTE